MDMPVALVEGLAGQSQLLVLLHPLRCRRSRIHSRCPCRGQLLLRERSYRRERSGCPGYLHTLDILGRGLQTNQNNLFRPCCPFFCIFSGEYDLAAGSTGRCTRALPIGVAAFRALASNCGCSRVSRLRDRSWQLPLLGSHALVYQVASDLQSSLSGSLAVSGLQHVELACSQR